MTGIVIKSPHMIRTQYRFDLKMNFRSRVIQLYGKARENSPLYLHFQCYIIHNAIPKKISIISKIMFECHYRRLCDCREEVLSFNIVQSFALTSHSLISKTVASAFIILRDATPCSGSQETLNLHAQIIVRLFQEFSGMRFLDLG